jgi:hypothetical protein
VDGLDAWIRRGISTTMPSSSGWRQSVAGLNVANEPRVGTIQRRVGSIRVLARRS